jgi:hypothetical protein
MRNVERQHLSRPLTEQEQGQALAAFVAAERFSAELLERQGGQPFTDSTEILREIRQERTRRLA